MSMTSLDAMKTKVSTMLKGIERYNPENIQASAPYCSSRNLDFPKYMNPKFGIMFFWM